MKNKLVKWVHSGFRESHDTQNLLASMLKISIESFGKGVSMLYLRVSYFRLVSGLQICLRMCDLFITAKH